MKQKPLNEFSKEELIAEVSKRNKFFIVSCFCVILMIVSGVFLFTQQGFGFFTILPLAFLPLLILSSKNKNEAKKELESRG